MPNYDRDMLIENIRIQMKKNDFSQQQLGEAIGMSQPNISKALNPHEKKNFTIAQIVDIADLFHVSVDSLLGRKGAAASSLTPRSIARFIVQMIESDDAEFFDHNVEEEVYELNDRDFPSEVTHKKSTIKYPALYLPSYWYIPADADPNEEQELLAEISQVGNDSAMMPVNNFLQHFRAIFPIYKSGELPEDTYHTVIEDMLSKLRD